VLFSFLAALLSAYAVKYCLTTKGIPILAKGIAVEIPSVFHAGIGTESPVPKAFDITKKCIYWKLLFL
jgi:hypothetical protein